MTGITVLGPVAVGDDGASLSPRDRVVLSVLVARRGREVSADVLAEALWGEELPPSWHKVVQGCVARLRRRVGHDAIVTGRAGYRLVVPAEDVDAGRFERLVHRARELLSLDHADQAAYAVDEALRLWRGQPLADLEDWEPGRGEAERLTELRLQAEELRLGALLVSGRHAEVLPEATLRVQEQPLREHRWGLLARAQYQDGRQAEALATLRRARETLADELGLDPGTELTELEKAVLQQDPDLSVPAAGLPAAACPWPGLAPYDVDDSDTFFGREAELAACQERLSHRGLLAVVGPSGSGKSSLVRAGLTARLRRAGRHVRIITPGPRPLDALADATSGRGQDLTLVVDQCEEVFAATVPPQVRASFLQDLSEVARNADTQVVLTLRADRLGELAAYPAVARLVEEGLYLLKGIGRDGLRDAIEQPARRAGLLLEQGLVDLLVRDVEGEPGSLPLLAHALRQTWERREGMTLTVEGYRASGGIRGAVAQSAERVYEAASEEQRHALRELLLRMVQPGPGGEPVRTSLDRQAVADDEHGALVEELVRARLVTATADRLEIAHESLGRAWPRLQAWLADDVEGERIRHHLAAAANAWETMGRPDSELYRGARLAAAREWHATGTHRLGLVEQDFLAASEEAHLSSLARAEDEARRQRRLNQRLRLLVVGAVLLALVAAAFATVARVQGRNAREANEVAVSEAARARSHELAASALADLTKDPARAKSLAVIAAEVAPPGLQAAGALHSAYAADPVVSRLSLNRRTSETRVWAAVHPDGTRVALTGESAGEPAPALEVHDAVTGELVWEWARPDEPGYESAFAAGAAYTADGAVLASGVVWHPTSEVRLAPPADRMPDPPGGLLGIHLWDGTTHEPLGVLDVGPCGGWPLEITDDVVLVRALVPSTDPALAAVTDDPVLAGCRWWEGGWGQFVVDRRTGERTLLGVMDPNLIQWNVGAALSGDGSVAAVWDQRGTETTLGDRNDVESTALLDTATGREIGRIRHTFPFDLDATGERILLRDRDVTDTNARSAETWRVMTVKDQRTVATFAGHEGRPTYAAFSDDASTVFSTGLDNVLVEWDASTGEELRRVLGTGSGRAAAAGGRWVVVPRPLAAGALMVDTFPRSEGWSVPPCDGFGSADQLRVAGDRVVTGRGCEGASGELELFTLGTGERRTFRDAVWNEALAVSPDGTRVVAQTGSAPADGAQPVLGGLQVRDLATGDVEVALQGFCGPASGQSGGPGCAPSPEAPFAGATYTGLRWSPDGRWISGMDAATAGLAVWDASTGELAWTGVFEESQVLLGPWDDLFSSDSERLVVSTDASQLVAFDSATGEQVASAALPAGGNHISPGLVGHSADGSLVVVSPLAQNATNTSFLLVDPDTLETRRTFSGVVDGAVRAAAVSPDRTRVALAASEGFVGVWDLTSGALLDRADPGLGSLEGVQWLDDHDLLVLSGTGAVVTVTTDPDRLVARVRDSLTRGLTLSECAAYQIAPCPHVGALRGADPSVPDELRGTYEVSWTAADLLAAGVEHYEDAYGAALDDDALARLQDFADGRAGNYRVTFTDDGYAITDGEDGEWCTGAVTVSAARPGRLLLGAERGAGCVDFHYAEVGWEVDEDGLHLPRESFRGSQLDAVLLTSKPLQPAG